MSYPYRIETERLILRSPSLDDVEEVNAAIHETWEELHRWMAWAVVRPTLEETRAIRARQVERQQMGLDYSLLAFDRETGRFVAAIGLHPERPGVFSVGYWRRAGFAGRGLVTEATMAVAEFAFDQVQADRLELRCRPDNLPSRAVAERCGFAFYAEVDDEESPGRKWLMFERLRATPPRTLS